MSATNTVRVVFAGGGTGGHLYPAIAIADRLQELSEDGTKVEILFVGTKRGLEYRLGDSLGYPLQLINMRGLVRSFTWKNLLLPFFIVSALVRAAMLLSRFAPDIVVGTGGYVSWPILKMATIKNIPTVIQEQNSYPGIATRRGARRARRVYLGFEKARDYLQAGGEVIVTGNPVRRSIEGGNRSEALATFGLDSDRVTILILGGSQGAHAINEAVLKSMTTDTLSDKYQLLWQTGKRDYRDVTAKVGDKVKGRSLFPFAARMDLVYAAADLAVARAGAITLAEMAVCGIPAILIPYPFAAENHQRINARESVKMGTALMIDQTDLGRVDLIGEAVSLLESDRFSAMKQALRQMTQGRKPAADIIARDITKIIEVGYRRDTAQSGL